MIAWLDEAERMFKRAQVERMRLDAKRRADEQAARERARQIALEGQASPAPAPPPPPVAALTPPPPPAPYTPPAPAPVPAPLPVVVAPPDGAEWTDIMTKAPSGALASTLHNARTLLRNHEDFRGLIRWNEVTKRAEVVAGPMRRYSRLGTDGVVAGIVDWLSSQHGVNVAHKDLGRRVYAVSREFPFDPIGDYLNSLRWDGVARADTWLSTYCGAVETDENRAFLRMVGRRWLISLVARGLDPGCKVDNVLVLKGPGGMGKSVAFEIIGGEWFCDTAINLGDKDSRMMAGRYWLCELAECVAFKRSGHDVLKNFFSSRIDKFRPPYGGEIEEFPRRCVFVGTLNEDQFLTDPTGNRKYWIVEVFYTPEATTQLRRDRDLLLAEAVAAYRAGEKWHFGYEEIPITERESEKYMVQTPAGMKVRAWWFGLSKEARPRDGLTTLDVWEQAFDAPASQAKDNDLMRVGHALSNLGFVRRRDTTGTRDWRHYPTEKLLEADRVESKRRTLFAIPGGKRDDARK